MLLEFWRSNRATVKYSEDTGLVWDQSRVYFKGDIYFYFLLFAVT